MDQIIALFYTLLFAVWPGGGDERARLSGYLEADYIYLAPAMTGRIGSLPVRTGDPIAQGAVVFRLEDARAVAALAGAQADVAAARARLDNLNRPARAEEIAAIRARLETALAERELAGTDEARTQKLRARGVMSEAALDASSARLKAAQAQVDQLQANLETAGLPVGRAGEIAAAEAELHGAQARVRAARADLADTALMAPATGHVEDVYFSAGELVSAGAPVVQILPDNALKLVFFVPEALRPEVDVGDRVAVSCDDCPPGIFANVTHLASEPQYTPPVIYSRTQRQRLSYRVEARIEDARGLAPGQPIDAELLQ